MSAPSKKNASEPIARRFVAWLFGPGRTAATVAVILVAFIAGAYLAWMNLKPSIFNAAESQIDAERIELTPQPAWLAPATNIRKAVVQTLSAEAPLSIHDENLVMRLKNGFETHPWIERVIGIRKLPDRVKVDVSYRKPVCMIKVPTGRLPVDASGFLLPSDDFTPVQAATEYLVLESVDREPTTPVGCRWTDARVLGAAEIAAAIGSDWKNLQLVAIVPQLEPTGVRLSEPTFWLTAATRGNSRILWGYAPGANASGELPPAEKVARLKRYFADHDTFDGPENRHQELDIRTMPPSVRP